jgi:hypothetical protein
MALFVAGQTRLAFALALTLGIPGLACKSNADSTPEAVPSSAPSSRPRTPDRLAAGELAESADAVFGFRIPRKMRLAAHFGDTVHLAGALRPEDVANYVRERVVAERVEIGTARTIFPHVRIKQGDPKRAYEFQVIAGARETQLLIKDLTPPVVEQGLSVEERWRRAGMTPSGKPLPDLK